MNAKIITIVILSVTSFALLISTVFFAFASMMAQANFEDQVDVTRSLVQGFDALDRFDVQESERHFDDAMTLQQDILDRNGLEQFDY